MDRRKKVEEKKRKQHNRAVSMVLKKRREKNGTNIKQGVNKKPFSNSFRKSLFAQILFDSEKLHTFNLDFPRDKKTISRNKTSLFYCEPFSP